MRRSPPLRSFRVAPRARTTLRARRRASNGLIHELRPRRATAHPRYFPRCGQPVDDARCGGSRRSDDPVEPRRMTGRERREHDLACLSGKSARTVARAARERAAVPGGVAHDEHEPRLIRGSSASLRFARRIVASAAPDPADPFDRRSSPSGARDDRVPRSAVAADRERHLGPPAHRRMERDRETPRAAGAGRDRRSARPPGTSPIRRSSPSTAAIAARSAMSGAIELAALEPSERSTRPTPAARATACWLQPERESRDRAGRDAARASAGHAPPTARPDQRSSRVGIAQGCMTGSPRLIPLDVPAGACVATHRAPARRLRRDPAQLSADPARGARSRALGQRARADRRARIAGGRAASAQAAQRRALRRARNAGDQPPRANISTLGSFSVASLRSSE